MSSTLPRTIYNREADVEINMHSDRHIVHGDDGSSVNVGYEMGSCEKRYRHVFNIRF